jgi:hypothetical protein
MLSLCLCSRGWATDLLSAAEMPRAVSIAYMPDLRHLFLQRWARELGLLGIRATPKYPVYFKRESAELVASIASENSALGPDNAEFCFRYGADDFSFKALNHWNPYVQSAEPRHFLDKTQPVVLGNFALYLRKAASSLLVHPPAEVQAAGIAEVALSTRSSLLVWLGVRYRADEVDAWLRESLDAVELSYPLSFEGESGFCGTDFVGHYARGMDLTAEDERCLRQRMGFHQKGKPIREQVLYETVCGIFGGGNVIRRYRGKELEGLELDIYVPSLRLGIEYQGQQHTNELRHWHGKRGFEMQLQRDARKRLICKDLGIRLLYFGPDDGIDSVSVITAFRRNGIL